MDSQVKRLTLLADRGLYLDQRTIHGGPLKRRCGLRYQCVRSPTAVASASSAPGPARGATLLVNDPDAVGALGGARLSLDEAIRLANGSLGLESLSGAQRSQVHGIPGPHSRDVIKLVVTTISSPPAGVTKSAASALRGNDGDSLDGNGAYLTGSAPKGIGLIVSSSNFSLHNLTVGGFEQDVVVDPAGQALKNISVVHTRMLPAVLGDLLVGARTSHSSLVGLNVTDNVFYGQVDATPRRRTAGR
jgi:hypothetical protein